MIKESKYSVFWILLSVWFIFSCMAGEQAAAAQANQVESQEGEQDALSQSLQMNKLSVEVLSESINGSIGGGPGQNLLDEPLRINITSPVTGWRVMLYSSELRYVEPETESESEADSIASSEMVYLASEGRRIPLDKPCVRTEKGDSGCSLLESRLAVDSATFHKPGTYRGCLYVVLQGPRMPPSRPRPVPVEIQVRARARHHLEGNKVYFHIGNPMAAAVPSAVVSGKLYAEVPVCLELSRSEGRVDRLPMVKPFLRKARATEKDLALNWKLYQNNAGRDPLNGEKIESSVTWALTGTPGSVEYKLECEVRPEAYQSPGDYGASYTLTIKPRL